jgi:Uma2 family endonuclease
MSAAIKIKNVGSQVYTYRDYLDFPEDGKRWELIDGIPYLMAAPMSNHQLTLGELFGEFRNHLKNKKCKAFLSPFDVRIPLYNEKRDEEITTVVQPDITVYCDRNKYDQKGGRAAPELAVEVLSPSSGRMDKFRKFMLYERAGVKEYWLVDPADEMVEIYRLKDGKFQLIGRYIDEDMLPAPEIGCEDLADFKITAMQIFESNIKPQQEEDEQ